MKYQIINTELKHSGFVDVELRAVSYERFRAKELSHKTFEVVAKNDACAVLIYNKDRKAFVLVRQFRPSASTITDPYLIEIVAGGLDKGESPVEGIKRESMEEAGYRLSDVELISDFFVAPGFATERIYLYYAEVKDDDRITQGGGLEHEQEDIEVLHWPASEIQELIQTNRDAKTLIALQWYAIHQMKN